MKKIIVLIFVGLTMAGCASAKAAKLQTVSSLPAQPQVTATPTAQPTQTPEPSSTPTLIPTAVDSLSGSIPNFDHIVLIVLENEYLQNVVGSVQMPKFNALAARYVLLSNYFAITHPSLPNYLALISGSTQNVTTDCSNCFVDQPNLADEVEASGRTWKAYFEGMPSPCFVGSKQPYVQWDNPFIYFDSIRLDAARCKSSVVPLTQLDKDLSAKTLPNFAFIMADACNSGHDCPATTADAWMAAMVAKLQASPALGQNSLIIITFDEGVKKNSNTLTRGQVATLLISPMARQGFTDSTAYSHYSLLKTILAAWNLSDLGQTSLPSTQVIQAPWLSQEFSAGSP